MRVMVVTAHPVETSYNAAIHQAAIAGLREAGHDVDHCDLYAERFDPVLSRDAQLDYHDPALNRRGVEGLAERLGSAEGLVLGFPTWCFGPPAILKGFFDRVWVPGFAFTIDGGTVTPTLRHIRSVAGLVTYGRARHVAWWMGDPPRKLVTGYVRWFVHPKATVRYHAHYHLNVATADDRARFIAGVREAMRRF